MKLRNNIIVVGSFILATPANAVPPCSNLYQSGRIVVNSDWAQFDGVVIKSWGGGAAFDTNGHAGVGLNHAIIYHTGGPGYLSNSGHDNWIANSVVIYVGAHSTGQNSGDYTQSRNVDCESSPGFIMQNVLLINGSTGAYVSCNNSQLTQIEGRNQRGPYPGGQFVQFSNMSWGFLTNFYNFNDKYISWPEDNVSIYQSTKVSVSNGRLDGNNSINGSGLEADLNSHNISFTNIDITGANNTCAGSWAIGTYNIYFTSIHCRDMMASSYRGSRSGGPIAFVGQPVGGTGKVFYDKAEYFNIPSNQPIFLTGAPFETQPTNTLKIDFDLITPFKATPPCTGY